MKKKNNYRGYLDSNQAPTDLLSDALPNELYPQFMLHTGIEPVTFALLARRSYHLS